MRHGGVDISPRQKERRLTCERTLTASFTPPLRARFYIPVLQPTSIPARVWFPDPHTRNPSRRGYPLRRTWESETPVCERCEVSDSLAIRTNQRPHVGVGRSGGQRPCFWGIATLPHIYPTSPLSQLRRCEWRGGTGRGISGEGWCASLGGGGWVGKYLALRS